MSEGAHDNSERLHLQLLLPTEVLVDREVVKVIAEAENGEFCLLPRHIDFVAALVPGVLSFYISEEEERFAAIDEGILVKSGRDVLISTPNGVLGTDLAKLQSLVEDHFLELDEHERKVRSALARLEAGTVRGFWELQERHRG
ncbi:MAG: F0F1 ATP synthase subunit epsilon [Gammaproteobacteria bacterium]|nr:F0F1 ATP synthase subunit epsilon [Gammaproteobacteria bacterium]MCW8839784.1 F0F1 ATP synthase subunit epsilon [Gammaproteobacteria bacterium]MCW8928060.1 F0F1 ATP synthase subunit epsilon [Gammaproteobacteria bacterium]MCW8957761.1 F0F1 ATP synthase subunit epsilon [Gammaproteobacteria bacterium]MCW8972499.1 F0F1 ATP synthase subunit epsilon [Gammaproteobacteria bacterium]